MGWRGTAWDGAGWRRGRGVSQLFSSQLFSSQPASSQPASIAHLENAHSGDGKRVDAPVELEPLATRDVARLERSCPGVARLEGPPLCRMGCLLCRGQLSIGAAQPTTGSAAEGARGRADGADQIVELRA